MKHDPNLLFSARIAHPHQMGRGSQRPSSQADFPAAYVSKSRVRNTAVQIGHSEEFTWWGGKTGSRASHVAVASTHVPRFWDDIDLNCWQAGEHTTRTG